jgi:hypothetical protein
VSQEREIPEPHYHRSASLGPHPTSIPQPPHLERTNSEGPTHHHTHPHLSKSQSFSAEPHGGAAAAGLFFPPNGAAAAPSSGGGGIISPLDIQRARSQLKSSRSFPDMAEDGDNSSSGVSSDQDQDSVVTMILPKGRGIHFFQSQIVGLIDSLFNVARFRHV